MKKLRIIPVIVLGLVLLAGCGETEDELTKFRDAYAKTGDAVTVTQSIEVLRGELAVYLYDKQYEKTETGYEMSYTEQRLNKADAETEEAYTVTTGSDTVPAAETFNPALTLDLEDFRYGYELQRDSFRGELKAGREDAVFGFTKDHAEMKDVTLSLLLDGNSLKELTVAFVSRSYSVSITLTFYYN